MKKNDTIKPPAIEVEPESLLREELQLLAEKKARSQTALLIAQKALAESQSFDLDYRNTILQLFLKYKMSMDDRLDEQTGQIMRASDENDAIKDLTSKEGL